MRWVASVTGVLIVASGAARAEPAGSGSGGVVTTARSAENLRVSSDGWLRFGALLQGWWVLDHHGSSRNTFRLRRAEFVFRGEVVPARVFFGVMVNPARVLEPSGVKVKDTDDREVTVMRASSALAILQDFYVGISTPVADFSIGQFKNPISYEGFQSSAEIIFAERALLSRGLGTLPFYDGAYKSAADDLGLAGEAYGEKRDLGVKVEKLIGPVYYFVGLFNGAGSNRLDTDSRKDLTARIQVFPIKGLMLGVAGYATLRQGWRTVPDAKERAEFDVRYEVGSLLVQAEYLFARDYNKNTKAMTPSQGTYLATALRLPYNFEAAGRFGWWDLDIDNENTQVWEAAGGIHYYLKSFNANLKLNYAFYRPTFQGLEDIHEVILAAQVKF